MQSSSDISTVDLARTCLQLRSDLTFIPQKYGGLTWVHIEVESSAAFYRVGFTEYVFLSLLDGQTTFAEALAITARSQGPAALTEERAHALYQWVLEEQLGQFVDTQVAESRLASEPKQRDVAQKVSRLNPFWIRLPLGRPDQLLKILNRPIGWLFSVPASILGTAFILLMGLRLFAVRGQLELASRQVFAPDNWIWLLAAWVVLKICHEAAHGLVCQRYGGEVRESGIILAFFAPLAYVDVTSSWAFNSRWQRIHTALAGIYVELLIASVAAVFWLSTESELTSHLLYNMIVMASLSTILFNANPLMRFDGYYVLSDLLQLPNLASRSSEALRQMIQRLLLGTESSASIEGTRTRTLLIYGVAAALWKVLICTSLVIAASVLFHGAGVALAIAGVVAWAGIPAMRLARTIQVVGRNTPMRLVRASMLSSGMVGLVIVALWWTPVPFGAVAPGVVKLADGSTVRAEVDGVVEELHVVPGQHVLPGDRLVTLRNRELEAEHADLVLQMKQATLRRRAAVNAHEAGDAQVAADLEVALTSRLEKLSEQIAGLTVKARVEGNVLLRNISQLKGRYAHEGDELMMIDNQLPLQLCVSVAQEDQPQLQALNGKDVRVRVGTRPVIWGKLKRVNPRATLLLSHTSLAAPEGGQLTVVADDENGEYELTEHRFEAVIELPCSTTTTGRLSAGERGHAVFGSASPTLAGHVYHVMSDWIDAQFAMATREAL